MSEKISNGLNDAVQNAEEIRYSPNEGWSGTWAREGPKNSVKALLNQLAALGYTFVYSSDQNPNGVVRYSTVGAVQPGGSESPTLQWEYFANRAEIDILEADISGAYGTFNVNAISDDNKRRIRAAIASPADNSPAISGSDAIGIYLLMLQGVRSFRVNVPTLRVSKLVSAAYPVKASLSNVGRIISTNTLEVQEAIPSTILFELPNQTSTKAGFNFGWYKNHPNVQQSGYKWNVSQEWEYGLWPVGTCGTLL